MRTCVLLLPGDLDTPTGGYRYDRRIAEGLRLRGWRIDVLSLQGDYPLPDAAARARAEAAVAALPDGTLAIGDGLAFGALPDTAERHAHRLRWVALVHHPLAMETGLSAASAAALMAGERRAVATAGRVVVTSQATARLLDRLAMAASPVTVIEPGCDIPAPTDRGPGAQVEVQLLCVASVTARKGHLVLLDALARLRGLPWTLHCVGSLTLDPTAAAAARAAAVAHGLLGRVHWHGAAEAAALSTHYARADLFVLPSLFEGYGMALAEALAHGLPVVGTDTGAAADLLASGAGVLVPPGDAEALGAALGPVLSEPARRAKLRQVSLAMRARLPTWPAACERWDHLLQEVGAPP